MEVLNPSITDENCRNEPVKTHTNTHTHTRLKERQRCICIDRGKKKEPVLRLSGQRKRNEGFDRITFNDEGRS